MDGKEKPSFEASLFLVMSSCFMTFIVVIAENYKKYASKTSANRHVMVDYAIAENNDIDNM